MLVQRSASSLRVCHDTVDFIMLVISGCIYLILRPADSFNRKTTPETDPQMMHLYLTQQLQDALMW